MTEIQVKKSYIITKNMEFYPGRVIRISRKWLTEAMKKAKLEIEMEDKEGYK